MDHLALDHPERGSAGGEPKADLTHPPPLKRASLQQSGRVKTATICRSTSATQILPQFRRFWLAADARRRYRAKYRAAMVPFGAGQRSPQVRPLLRDADSRAFLLRLLGIEPASRTGGRASSTLACEPAAAALGVIGILVAAGNIWALFIQWLSLLGVLVPPIGAIILADQDVVRPGTKIATGCRPMAFVAWAIGSAVALVVENAAPQYSTALSSIWSAASPIGRCPRLPSRPCKPPDPLPV
jgi:hypothetical protein